MRPFMLAFGAVLIANGAALAQEIAGVRHVVVAIEEGKFHGWPANNGVWQWGDEILVGFTQGDLEVREGHNLTGIQESLFARSLDGGETWAMFDPENFLDDENVQWLPKGKTRLETPLDFEHEGFAMRVFATGYHGNDDPDGGFYYSYDRGRTWQGPHFLGDIHERAPFQGNEITARTDYIVTGPEECFVFIGMNDLSVERSSRVGCLVTRDGGVTFQLAGWVTPATEEYRAIMPSTVRVSDTTFVTTIRKIYIASLCVVATRKSLSGVVLSWERQAEPFDQRIVLQSRANARRVS